MTATLPTPGADNDVWGTELNTFLLVAHNADGTLNASTLSATGDITFTSDSDVSGAGDAIFKPGTVERMRVDINGNLTFKNKVSYNLNGGGHPTIAAQTNLFTVNAYGHLLGGQNLLVPLPNPTVGSQMVADFMFSGSSLRIHSRSLDLSEVDDPPNLTFRRFGPSGGYPYAGGAPNTMTAQCDTGTIIGQVNAAPSEVPFGGDLTTTNVFAPNITVGMNFVTEERARDWTGNQGWANGTGITFVTTRIGHNPPDTVARFMAGGNFKFGRQATADSAHSPVFYIRGEGGVNQQDVITIPGTVTGGTFTLTFFGPTPTTPVNTFAGAGVTTAPIAYNASAATVQTAVEALSGIGAGNTTVAGGPLGTAPVTVTYSGVGVTARTNYATLSPTPSGFTGSGTVSVVTNIPGIPDHLGTVPLMVVHGGQTGDTPTSDYFDIFLPGLANKILFVDNTGALNLKPNGTAQQFVVGQTGVGFFSGTQKAQQGAVGNTHTVTAGSTTSVFTNTTFDGGSGSSAYTIGDLVKAFKAYGLLAA